MVNRQKSPFKPSQKTIALLAVFFFVVGAATFGCYNIFNKQKNHSSLGGSSASTATKSNDMNHPAVGSSDFTQGGAVDKNGGTTPTSKTTAPSLWTSSTSGNITLQQPTANSTVISGDTIRGTAKISTIQYRLVDDTTGVIAQGSLNVVNGSFSGILQFKAYSSTGALKVFSIDPGSGAEINHADIKINLSP